MMIYVANPLYDAVFKYMMEDERIAKTLLSALLQKTVIAVEMRRHEFPKLPVMPSLCFVLTLLQPYWKMTAVRI